MRLGSYYVFILRTFSCTFLQKIFVTFSSVLNCGPGPLPRGQLLQRPQGAEPRAAHARLRPRGAAVGAPLGDGAHRPRRGHRLLLVQGDSQRARGADLTGGRRWRSRASWPPCCCSRDNSPGVQFNTFLLSQNLSQKLSQVMFGVLRRMCPSTEFVPELAPVLHPEF